MCGWQYIGYETPEGVVYTQWGLLTIELAMACAVIPAITKGDVVDLDKIGPTVRRQLVEGIDGDKQGPIPLDDYLKLVSDGNYLLRDKGLWSQNGWFTSK